MDRPPLSSFVQTATSTRPALSSFIKQEPVSEPSLFDRLLNRGKDVLTSFSPQTAEQKREYTPLITPITGTLGAAGGAVMDIGGAMIENIASKKNEGLQSKYPSLQKKPFGERQLFSEGTQAGEIEKKINDSMSKWASDMLGGAQYGYEASKLQNPKTTAIAKDLFNATGLLGTGQALTGLKADIATTRKALAPTAEQQVARYTKAVTDIASDYEKSLPLTPTQKAKEGMKLDKTGDNVYTTLAKNGIEVGSGKEISQLNEISNTYDNAVTLAQQNEHQLFSVKRIVDDAVKQIDERITSSVARESAKNKVRQEIASLLQEQGNKSMFFTDVNGDVFIKSPLVERLRKTGNSWTPFNAADPEKIGMSTGYALSNAVRNEVEAFGTFPAYREAMKEWGKVINATDILSNIEKAGKPFRSVGGLSGSIARRVLSGALGYHMGGIGGAVLTEIGSEYAARILSNPQLRTYFDRKIVQSSLSKNPTPVQLTKLADEIEQYVFEQTKRVESGMLLPEPAIRMPAKSVPEPKGELVPAKIGKPYQVPKGQPGAGQMRRSYTSEAATQSKTTAQSQAMSAPSKIKPTNTISSTVQRTRDLRKADKRIIANKRIKKTTAITKLENKIAENVKAQKAAIKAKDYTLVAKLKTAYDILVAELKKAIKYLNENASVGMATKDVTKKLVPEDMKLMEEFIDSTRTGKKLSRVSEKSIDHLLERLGFSPDMSANTIANRMEKIRESYITNPKGTNPTGKEGVSKQSVDTSGDFGDLSSQAKGKSLEEFVKAGMYSPARDSVARNQIRKSLAEVTETRKANTLKENPNNPPIDKSTVNIRAEDIREGKRPYIVIDGDMIIDGHHTYQAYLREGITDIPVVTKSQLTDIWNKANRKASATGK